MATGKLALSTGFDGAQMQRRLMSWRAGGESINSLILQGGELQRARARQLVRTNPYAANAAASFATTGAKIGGLKVTTENAWFAARPSGTEDVYKIYAESFKGADHLKQVQAEAKAIVDGVIS